MLVVLSHYSLQGKRVKDITNRIRVAQPQSRDGSGGAAEPKSTRPACIPPSVLAKRLAATSGAVPSQPMDVGEETELQLQVGVSHRNQIV